MLAAETAASGDRSQRKPQLAGKGATTMATGNAAVSRTCRSGSVGSARARRRRAVLLLGLGVAAVLALGCSRVQTLPHSTADQPATAAVSPRVLAAPRQAAPFTLTDQRGQPFAYAAGQAEATVLFFGYTFCPDVCPVSLAEFRQVLGLLGPDAERTRFIFVSVDPERDTPARLQDYLGRFAPRIIGLTGTPEEVDAVVQAYGVVADKQVLPDSEAGYLMIHTATSFLIDGAGSIRAEFPFGTPPEAMEVTLRRLLDGGL